MKGQLEHSFFYLFTILLFQCILEEGMYHLTIVFFCDSVKEYL